MPLRRHREHALAVMQELRLIDSDVLEERADCRQARIPTACSVSARTLDVSQERSYQLCIDIREFQMGRRLLELGGRILQEKTKRVSIADDCIWARFQLRPEALGEEALQVCCKNVRFHRVPPFFEAYDVNERSARSEASCSSSGVASIYQ
jgi:hypothetical protein